MNLACAGDDSTGTAAALLFAVSAFPVALGLLSRVAIRHLPAGEGVKAAIQRANLLQRRSLMPLHAWAGVLALGVAALHLARSRCAANPLPEAGLLVLGLLVATGLLHRWRAVPTPVRKVLHRFHTNLVVSSVALAILLAGHAVMDSD